MPSNTIEPHGDTDSDPSEATVNATFMGMEGVWEGDKFYFNRRKEGYVDGKHFVEYVEPVKNLKRKGELDEAEVLLLKLVDATEAESKRAGRGVAPWYYQQLAIIYHRQGQPEKELAILKRYDRQEKSPGVKPAVLAKRLLKLEASQRNRKAPK